jgi:hypothetical protein
MDLWRQWRRHTLAHRSTSAHTRMRVRKTLPKRTEAKTYAQAGVSGVEVEMVTEIVFTCQETAGFIHWRIHPHARAHTYAKPTSNTGAIIHTHAQNLRSLRRVTTAQFS